MKIPAADTPPNPVEEDRSPPSSSTVISPPTPQPDSVPQMASEKASPQVTSQAAPLQTTAEDAPSPITDANPHQQVHFKSEAGRLLLQLPPNSENSRPPMAWSDLWLQLKQRLSGGERFWQPHTAVHLAAGDRLLDGRQLQAIAEVLAESQLQLKQVYTSRRQTAVAAATAGYSVDQNAAAGPLSQTPTETSQALADPLYLQTTIRSGIEIRHPGTVVILGDVNPGGSVIADGDILIWGHLRGIAHAGAGGQTNCRIMALHMQPTQLRIADKVARAPETPPAQYQPEVAYIGSNGIRIAIAAEFTRGYLARSFG